MICTLRSSSLLDKMLVLWMILLVVAVLAIYLIQKRASAHPLPPAYPGAWPLIGHTHMLLGDGKKIWSIIKTFSHHSIKEGGVITCQFGLDYYYFITDPEDALTVANTCFAKKHFTYKFLEGLLGQGIGMISDVDRWKNHRNVLTPAFSMKNTCNFIGIYNSQSKKLVDKIEKFCGKEPVNLTMYLKENTMETSLTTMFGSEMENKDQPYYKYSEAADKFLQIATTRFQNVWLHFDWIYKLLGYEKQVEQLRAGLNIIGEKALNIAKANEGSLSALKLDNRFRTFLEVFLQSPGISSLSDEEIKSEVNTMIGAAYETSSNQVLFILHYIASHPEVQKRVYNEIIEVVGKERDIEKEDLPNLKYTKAVVNETLRVLPIIPTVIRYIDRELKLKNYTLRPGMNCILSLYGINHHPDWVDPHRFRPERWLHPNTLPAKSNTFAAFSLGKRNCIGKAFAMIALTVQVAHIVRAYQLTAACDNMQCSFELTLKAVAMSEISLQRRN